MMNTSIWILGDQLIREHPALVAARATSRIEQLRVVLVESRARATRHPYQRKKLVLLFSAMRHYAAELREYGYQVDLVHADDIAGGLIQHVAAWEPQRIYCMAASEYSGRSFQAGLASQLKVPVVTLPNTQFLIGQFDPIPKPVPGKRYVMEGFYRRMRRRFNLLIQPDGEPLGGRWNFDSSNRRPLLSGTQAPDRLRFEPDEITRQVMAEVEGSGEGVGNVEGFDLAVTHAQAARELEVFFEQRLDQFGPFEDAMSSRSDLLFHSHVSPYINIGLLEPLPVVKSAEERFLAGKASLESVEGFIRQVIGWREFICWQYWRQMPGLRLVNFWNAQRKLPGFFWDGVTDLNCLRTVIQRALQSGYSHHIERLMVVSNFCLLAGISPQQVNDWFLACYIDAYEWVMLPNVLGMGLYADGGLTATKPYISSANYINKMSDYCKICRFNPKERLGEQACPFNYLYWNFNIQNESYLRANPRSGASVLGLKRITGEERLAIQARAARFLEGLDHPS